MIDTTGVNDSPDREVPDPYAILHPLLELVIASVE